MKKCLRQEETKNKLNDYKYEIQKKCKKRKNYR